MLDRHHAVTIISMTRVSSNERSRPIASSSPQRGTTRRRGPSGRWRRLVSHDRMVEVAGTWSARARIERFTTRRARDTAAVPIEGRSRWVASRRTHPTTAPCHSNRRCPAWGGRPCRDAVAGVLTLTRRPKLPAGQLGVRGPLMSPRLRPYSRLRIVASNEPVALGRPSLNFQPTSMASSAQRLPDTAAPRPPNGATWSARDASNFGRSRQAPYTTPVRTTAATWDDSPTRTSAPTRAIVDIYEVSSPPSSPVHAMAYSRRPPPPSRVAIAPISMRRARHVGDQTPIPTYRFGK